MDLLMRTNEIFIIVTAFLLPHFLLLCVMCFLHQVVVSLEEVEDEGLLISWTLYKQPSFALTVSPCKLQRPVRALDTDTINLMCPQSIKVHC